MIHSIFIVFISTFPVLYHFNVAFPSPTAFHKTCNTNTLNPHHCLHNITSNIPHLPSTFLHFTFCITSLYLILRLPHSTIPVTHSTHTTTTHTLSQHLLFIFHPCCRVLAAFPDTHIPWGSVHTLRPPHREEVNDRC